MKHVVFVVNIIIGNNVHTEKNLLFSSILKQRNIDTKIYKTKHGGSYSIMNPNKNKFENLKKKKRYAFKFNESDML